MTLMWGDLMVKVTSKPDEWGQWNKPEEHPRTIVLGTVLNNVPNVGLQEAIAELSPPNAEGTIKPFECVELAIPMADNPLRIAEYRFRLLDGSDKYIEAEVVKTQG